MPPPQLRAFANEPRKQLPELVQIIFERRRRSTTAFLIVLGARPVPVWPGEWGIKRDPFDDSSREEGVYWLSWSLAKSQPEAIVEMTNHLRARHAAPFSRGIRPQLACTRKNLNLIRRIRQCPHAICGKGLRWPVSLPGRQPRRSIWSAEYLSGRFRRSSARTRIPEYRRLPSVRQADRVSEPVQWDEY